MIEKLLALGAVLAVNAVLFYLIIRLRPPFAIAAFLVAYSVFSFFGPPVVRDYGVHQMLYSGLLYSAYADVFSAQNPYIAGYAITFPWLQYLVYGFIGETFDATPSEATRYVGYVGCLIVLITLFALSKCLMQGRTRPLGIGVILALVGTSWVGPDVPMIGLDTPWNFRGLPAGSVFFAMPWAIGFPLSMAALYCGLRFVSDRATHLWYVIAVLVLVAVAGLFYPFSWLGASVVLGGVSIFNLAFGQRQRALWLLSALVVATLLVLPYFLSIRPETAVSSTFAPRLNPIGVLSHFLLDYVFVLFPLIVMAVLNRKEILEDFRQGQPLAANLLAGALTVALVGSLVAFKEDTDYKIRVLGAILLALVAGRYLAGLWPRRWPVVVVVIFVMTFWWSFEKYRHVHVSWEYTADLPKLDQRHFQIAFQDEADRDLYDWILAETPEAAVFFDNEDSIIPAMTQRRMFVAYAFTSPGFSLDMRDFLARTCALGYESVDARIALARRLYAGPEMDPEPDMLLEALYAQVDAPLFAVARNPEDLAALAQWPFAEVIYRNQDEAVFKLQRPETTP
ncbi:MAG: hypothetical protein ACFBZ8_06805 [Opitutales bacterium]